MSTVDNEAFRTASGATAAGDRAEGRGQQPTAFEARLADRFLKSLGYPPVAFRLWNGETVGARSGVFDTVVFRDRKSLYRLWLDPERQFGDLYSEGGIEVEGDLVRLMETANRALYQAKFRKRALPKLFEAVRRRSAHTLAADRANVHRHYDLGNDFYGRWLGPTMQYTCAYYAEPDFDLEAAQIAKMDHVCRKVWLKPGESVVEAGCGWGALAVHMAEKYGVKVRSFNISQEQINYARDRAKALGVNDRVEYVLDDYRNITGHYDAFVSVGMLEHVGPANYAELGAVIRRSIGSNGRALLHSIGRDRAGKMNPWIEARIFPGGHPPSLAEMARIFEPAELSVLDVENLRLHYARTLEHWLERYEQSVDAVRQRFAEYFVRMWRLYLSGSIAAFRSGDLQLFQVVVAPRENAALPRTRARLYGGH